jgi:hypothetical protein
MHDNLAACAGIEHPLSFYQKFLWSDGCLLKSLIKVAQNLKIMGKEALWSSNYISLYSYMSYYHCHLQELSG